MGSLLFADRPPTATCSNRASQRAPWTIARGRGYSALLSTSSSCYFPADAVLVAPSSERRQGEGCGRHPAVGAGHGRVLVLPLVPGEPPRDSTAYMLTNLGYRVLTCAICLCVMCLVAIGVIGSAAWHERAGGSPYPVVCHGRLIPHDISHLYRSTTAWSSSILSRTSRSGGSAPNSSCVARRTGPLTTPVNLCAVCIAQSVAHMPAVSARRPASDPYCRRIHLSGPIISAVHSRGHGLSTRLSGVLQRRGARREDASTARSGRRVLPRGGPAKPAG